MPISTFAGSRPNNRVCIAMIATLISVVLQHVSRDPAVALSERVQMNWETSIVADGRLAYGALATPIEPSRPSTNDRLRALGVVPKDTRGMINSWN